jgi:hypothetical protein
MNQLKTTQRTLLELISIFKLSIAVMLVSGILVSSLGWAKSSKDIHEFIVPFEMKYSTKVSGMDIKLTQRLEQPVNGQYKENIIAKGTLGKVTEEGLFHISKQDRVTPESFSKKQKTILGKRYEFQEYDWQAKKLNFSFKKRTGSLNLQEDYQDTMTHKQQLRFDLASGLTDIYYTVIKNGQIKYYRYLVIGHEPLETRIGRLNTTILLRKDIVDGKELTETQSTIWLASDWDFLMLKLETIDKDSVKTMTFTQGTLNGQPITPIEAKAET